jgi:hypothetical protein
VSSRFQDIPIPRRTILAALIDELSSDDDGRSETLSQLSELLAAVYHFHFHSELEAMKRSYGPFNPDLNIKAEALGAAGENAAAAALTEALQRVLERGNYIRLTEEDLAHAAVEKSIFPLNLAVDTSVYEELVIYVRGESVKSADVARWYGLKTRTIDVPTFDRLCIYIRFKTADHLELSPAALKKLNFEPGTTILKLFRNIPKADVEMLFPNCRVQMRSRDKLFIGVPAIVGGIPVIAKMVPTVIALAIILGLTRGEIDSRSVVTGFTGLVILGAYLTRHWSKYKNRRVLFNKLLAENLYFRNLDNNEGVLTRLIDEAEEEESKEALLAYYFLLHSEDGLSEPDLDRVVEKWLEDRFDMVIDFEVDDALAKLATLELATETDGTYRVCSMDNALERLDARWDAFFPYSVATSGAD